MRLYSCEKREAAREIRRCESRDCALREMREGQREVDRERREARNEIRPERAENYYQPARYDRNVRYYYYDDGRYYGSPSYSDAHYHPDGQYCRDGHYGGRDRYRTTTMTTMISCEVSSSGPRWSA